MMRLALTASLLLLAACQQLSTPPGGAAESGPDGSARNVILFVGDGMGVSTVTAARILEGQKQGRTGEEHYLSFERFPNVALVKTYNTDLQVPDSAGTMTALVTGHKTRAGILSVTPAVKRRDCAAVAAASVPTLMELAEDAGLATGVVSTARITHATPAANFAHSADRNWEADSSLPPLAKQQGCVDIARQLVEFDHGDGIEVVLGGGRGMFVPEAVLDPEKKKPGARKDGRHLINEWRARFGGRYVWNDEDFRALDPASPEKVLGLFEYSHMQWEDDRVQEGGEPSLAAMTRFAIDKLQATGRGYYLVVEAGRIDHAHHMGNAARALGDTLAYAAAVAAAIEKTGDDTLILVTADHSHTLTISGYPARGNPILGKVLTPVGDPIKDARGRPYTTLTYANGPGYRDPDDDLTEQDTTDLNFKQPAAVPMGSETHAGEDVPAYATGPGADGVRGVMDQNELFFVMKRALLGD